MEGFVLEGFCQAGFFLERFWQEGFWQEEFVFEGFWQEGFCQGVLSVSRLVWPYVIVIEAPDRTSLYLLIMQH